MQQLKKLSGGLTPREFVGVNRSDDNRIGTLDKNRREWGKFPPRERSDRQQQTHTASHEPLPFAIPLLPPSLGPLPL